MKHTQVSNLLRRGAALALAAVLSIPTVYASAEEQKLQTVIPVVDGLTYYNTITVNRDSRLESYSLELEPDSDVYPILAQGSGTVYGLATINKAVSNAQEQGYHVLGAINTDYFSTESGVPLGIVIEDGVYKSSTEQDTAMVITDGRISLVEAPEVSISLINDRTGNVLVPDHLNKWRNTGGGLYLLNQDFSTVSTRTSTSGWYVRMKAVPQEGEEIPKLTVNSTIELEVTELLQTDEPAVIGPDEYILTADDGAGKEMVFQSFRLGDRITLTTSCDDEILSNARWAGGTGDVMIRDGVLTDSSDWSHIKEGRAPRTALGVKEDGTLLLYAVDGRQSGHSLGLTQLDLANELLEQGCRWAVNLDGGGSTAMSVWLPGQSGPAIRNNPSDGKARSCATYLLLVSDGKGSGNPERLAMKEDGLTVLAGTSIPLPETVVLDDGLNILDVELSDLTVTSRKELGDVAGGYYIAGTTSGTDTLRLRSRKLGLEGTVQIHVVDSLTSFIVSKEGNSAALQQLFVKPNEKIQLAVTGSYWNRTALWESAPVTWTVSNDLGRVDKNGLFTATEAGGSGTITATIGGLTQTIPVTMTNVHNDVTQEHWAYTAVEYCYQNGIVGGVSTTQFGRDNQIRRGDFMLMLYNALGKPAVTTECTFTDVAPTDYYYTALAWAQGAGLASGTGDGAYTPKASITREQAFTILRQAMPLLGKECPDGDLSVLDTFADKDRIADYAKGHTATLVAQGVVSGKGDGIDPRGNLTRAEMAALLYKLITYTPIPDVPADPAEPFEPVEPTDPAEPEAPVAPEEYTLSLNLSQLTLASGEDVTLSASLEPALEGAVITWTSSNPKAAVVSPEGVVTNLHPGAQLAQTVITAGWNGLTASCVVSCEGAEQSGVVFDAEWGLNVRSGPGTDYEVTGGLDNGAQVLILEAEDGWCRVLYRNRAGQAASGYVSADYIRLLEG